MGSTSRQVFKSSAPPFKNGMEIDVLILLFTKAAGSQVDCYELSGFFCLEFGESVEIRQPRDD
jgi:hypothetical protein